MKKIAVIILTGLLLAVSVQQLIAAPSTQALNFDLAITKIAALNEAIRVGDPIVYGVTFERKAGDTIPVSTAITLTLSASTKDPAKFDWQCSKPLTGTLKTVISSTVYFDDCQTKLRFEAAGNLPVKAELLGADGKTLQDQNPDNNVKEIQVSVEPYQTALPEEIARIFAGLGLLSAVMAIMAAGTEVMIDVLRVMLGMKSKVTATEALEQLRQVLPGELAALGANTEARESVRQLAAQVQVTLKPANQVVDAVNDLKAGNLSRAFSKLQEISPDAKNALSDFVDRAVDASGNALQAEKQNAVKKIEEFEAHYKQQARGFIKTGLDTVGNALKDKNVEWDAQSVKELGGKVERQIDAIRLDGLKKQVANFDPTIFVDTPDSTKLEKIDKFKDEIVSAKYLDDAAKTMADAIQAYSPNVVIAWIRNQRDLHLKTQRDAVKTQLTALVSGLSDFGFLPKSAVTNVNQQLDQLVESAMTATEPAIVSLENLLTSVEDRRNETQSPPRKVWRILRKMEHGTAVIVLGASGLVWLLCYLVLYLDSQSPKAPNPITPDVVNVLGTLFFGMTVAIVASLIPALVLYLERNPRWEILNKIPTPILIALWAIGLVWFVSLTQPVWQSWQKFLVPPLIALPMPLPATVIGLIALVEIFLLVWSLARLGDELYYSANSQPMSDVHDLHRIEFLWNKLRGEEINEPGEYGSAAPIIGLTPENAAGEIVKLADRHQDQEDSRLRWMRAISVAVGIILAYQLRVDVFDFLKIALPGIERINGTFRLPGLPSDLTVGMILTGFAASAGSAFWHDQLDRLQTIKKQAEGTATSLRQVKATITGETK